MEEMYKQNDGVVWEKEFDEFNYLWYLWQLWTENRRWVCSIRIPFAHYPPPVSPHPTFTLFPFPQCLHNLPYSMLILNLYFEFPLSYTLTYSTLTLLSFFIIWFLPLLFTPVLYNLFAFSPYTIFNIHPKLHWPLYNPTPFYCSSLDYFAIIFLYVCV